ncbi:hypothetical protein [Spirosoma flavum]|uniref:Uncharacterized protein n=1 Tax=Spirosoma flavum TaxID=2048557 RepID=A0ABW6AMR7_9BACT
MKITIKNIIDLWFAEDTPIRQYKIRMNPKPWAMCQQVSQDFRAPSGRVAQWQYRKSDKVAFAELVMVCLAKEEAMSEQEIYEMA